MSIATIKTEIRSAGGTYKIECKARDKTFVLDEPEELGGSNGGMNPGEAFLNALGGCKYMVFKMFYQKFRIDLLDLKIDMEGQVDPDALAGKNKGAKIGFMNIKTKYHINANNTEEEIEKFVDFVESHCPMQDSIVNTPEMTREIYGQK